MLNLLTLATVFCPFFSANKPSWRNRRNYGQILLTELQIFHRAESQGCLAEGLSIILGKEECCWFRSVSTAFFVLSVLHFIIVQ